MVLETSIDDPSQVFDWPQDHRRHGRSKHPPYACAAPAVKNKLFSCLLSSAERDIHVPYMQSLRPVTIIHTYITSSYQGKKFLSSHYIGNFCGRSGALHRVCISTSMLHPHIHEQPAGCTSLVTSTVIS